MKKNKSLSKRKQVEMTQGLKKIKNNKRNNKLKKNKKSKLNNNQKKRISIHNREKISRIKRKISKAKNKKLQ